MPGLVWFLLKPELTRRLEGLGAGVGAGRNALLALGLHAHPSPGPGWFGGAVPGQGPSGWILGLVWLKPLVIPWR